MALAKTYYSVNGRIIGERRRGEENCRDYMHDNLGNVVAVFQNDWEIAEASYKPYGELASNWNFNSHGYRFGWNGGSGYRRTNMAYTTHYVRARHYSQVMGAWTSRDPLWPHEMPYGYVNGMTMRAIDPSGMALDIVRNPPGCAEGTVMTRFPWTYEKYGWKYPSASICIATGPSAKPNNGASYFGSVITPEEAIKQCKQPCHKSCVAYNGGIYDPIWDRNGRYNSITPLKIPGRGQTGGIGTFPRGNSAIVPFGIPGGFGSGLTWPTQSMGADVGKARTGGCVDSSGNLVALFAVPNVRPQQTDQAFYDCMKKNCPSGSQPFFLDGGTSTEVMFMDEDGNKSLLVPGSKRKFGTSRPVHNWVVICEY